MTTEWNKLEPYPGFGKMPFGDKSTDEFRVHQRGFGDSTTYFTKNENVVQIGNKDGEVSNTIETSTLRVRFGSNFLAERSFNLTSIWIYVDTTDGKYRAELRTKSVGSLGTLLAVSDSIDYSGEYKGWVNFPLTTSYDIVEGTEYCLCIYESAVGSTIRANVTYETGSNTFLSTGSSWTDYADYTLKIWGSKTTYTGAE